MAKVAKHAPAVKKLMTPEDVRTKILTEDGRNLNQSRGVCGLKADDQPLTAEILLRMLPIQGRMFTEKPSTKSLARARPS